MPAAPPAGSPTPGCGELFLQILTEHVESDVVVVCQSRQCSPCAAELPDKEVEFYCHSEVLTRSCAMFADAAEFESLSCTGSASPMKLRRKRRRFSLAADDDIVFEVLRYIYCGAIYFHQGFRAGFAQFLSVVDFLGVEDMAERQGPAAGRLFAEPGLVQWLQDLQTEDILAFLRDESIAGMLEHGSGAVGFRILCSFLAKLIELRPRDLTVEVLGEDLYERLADFGAPRPRRPRAGPRCLQASVHHQREQLAADEEEADSQACPAEPPCDGPDGPVKRLLHLPGPVVYVVLGTGTIRCVNVGGLDPLRSLARDAPGEPTGDAMGDGPDGPDPAPGSAGALAQTAFLWHNSRVLPPLATRESLLSDDEPPHREVVVFQDSADGQQIFRHTLRRAEARRPEEAERLALALDALVAEAEERTPEGSVLDEVQLVYDSIHDMVNDVFLNRDFNHQGPCLMVAGTRPGGAAASAGLQFGSTLVQQTGPQELSISAPMPGSPGQTWAEWGSLAGVWLDMHAPAEKTIEVEFDGRPFGFSWTQDLDSHILIREVKLGSRAMMHKVCKGMVICSMALPDGNVISSSAQLVEALRGSAAPARVTFGWRAVRKCLTAHLLTGLELEECVAGGSSPSAAPTVAGADAALQGGGAALAGASAAPRPEGGTLMDTFQSLLTGEGGSAAMAARRRRLAGHGEGGGAAPAGASAAPRPEGRYVVVKSVPPGHPASREGIGPGWRVGCLHPGAAGELVVTSLQQLPAKLVSPSVTLAFAHPPPLHEVLPLDRSRRAEALLPEAWAECSGGAALHAAPWEELERWEQGPLPRMRCRARPPAVEADHSAGGGGSSSSAAGPATDGGPGQEFELVVLGSLPPQSRLAEQHLQVAGPQDVLAWEVRQGLDAAARISPGRRWSRLAVVAVRRGGGGDPAAPPGTPPPRGSWLGGLLFAESVGQVLFHWALHLQAQADGRPAQPCVAESAEVDAVDLEGGPQRRLRDLVRAARH